MSKYYYHLKLVKGIFMNILSADKISKHYGLNSLFSDISFGIEEGEKIGLIGINGAGKSTLLKILVGIEEPDEGQVITANNIRIGYLSQNPVFDPESTVLESVLQGKSLLMNLIREYETTLLQVENGMADPENQQKLLRLGLQMDEAQAWQLESEAKKILTRLGITDFNSKIGILSGGRRKRVALAGALINPVELLVLDEPTNQIDNQTVDWLEQYLKERKGALIMITHDRYFLDRVVDRIFELHGGNLYSYAGNYSLFLEKKAEREEFELSMTAKRQNLYRRELAWIRRGAKARSTKQQARIDRFEKLQSQMINAENNNIIEIASSGSTRLGKKIVVLRNVSKSFPGKPLILDFNYAFSNNDRVGIIGPNGVGKSTLLNLISGNLKPDQGEVDIGSTVKFGFFTQEHSEMNESLRVIDYIKEQAEFLPTADGGTISASQMLERFLFPPSIQYTPIANLSGGEKRRLYLLRILMSAPNVLLLDEPTNDLDIQTLSILENYLEDFPGVVITVSHDRYFLDRIAGKILAFEVNSSIQHFVGNYSDYLEYQKSRNKSITPAAAQKNTSAPPNNDAHRKERPLKLSFKEQREFDGIDALITDVEEKLKENQRKITDTGSDYLKLQELTAIQEKLQQQLEELMKRWVYLNERVEEIAKNKT